MDIRALIFDLDGVIADTLSLHYVSWQRLADEEGIPFSLEAYQNMLGLTRNQSLGVLLNGRAIAPQQAEDWLRRKNHYYLEQLCQLTPEDAAPGVAALVREAYDVGLKIGLGSSSQNARNVLNQLDLLKYFHAVGDANTVQHHKPAPDIYLWVAEQLKVSPAESVIFEDSDVGVQAARAGGFRVVGIGSERVADADIVLPTLAGVTLESLQQMLDGEYTRFQP
jgi:beta-phosphoglucomutase